jgi:ParB family chromosome partitioning protein
LIGDNVAVTGKVLSADGEQRMVRIDRIRPSALNPRKHFDEAELQELASSIRKHGLVQPLVVRAINPQGTEYEIVAGERRWRAAQKASLHEIPVIVRPLNDQEALEIAIIENVQRTDLNAIEEATGYRDRRPLGYKQEWPRLSQTQPFGQYHAAAEAAESVQKMVCDGELSAGHARALIGREDAEEVARDVVKRGLNVRGVEALFQTGRGGASNGSKAVVIPKDADIRAVEREMCDALGLSVVVSPGPNHTGEIIVRYKTLDQFEAVRKRLCGLPA